MAIGLKRGADERAKDPGAPDPSGNAQERVETRAINGATKGEHEHRTRGGAAGGVAGQKTRSGATDGELGNRTGSGATNAATGHPTPRGAAIGATGRRRRNRRRRGRLSWTLGFLFVWGCVGYSLGTSVLLGPVMWLTGRLRESGAGEGAERPVVAVVIVLYVILSLLASLWLWRAASRSPALHVRLGIPGLAFLSAAAALWLWMTPAELKAERQPERTVGGHFTFGPYPDGARLARLEREGYSAVVSLLHPAVVPFEPKLLADEKKAAARVGLELIHLPMLPWVGDNTESLKRLEQLARSGSGRYYVHCYLGRDRVRLAQAVVERAAGAEATTAAGLPDALHLADGVLFERGRVTAIETDVFLTPYPTDEELMAWIVPLRPGAVVSLLDTAQASNRGWNAKERDALGRLGLRFVELPLAAEKIDPAAVLEAVEAAGRLPRPLVVHGFLDPLGGRAPTSEAFLQTWRSGLPSIPPGMFGEPLSAGPVRVVAPNLAVGPRPAGPEFWRLRCAGIRGVLFVGEDSEATRLDRAAARAAPLSYRATDAGRAASITSSGGPWYLYGSSSGALAKTIEKERGPAIPARSLVARVAPPAADESPRAGSAQQGTGDAKQGTTATEAAAATNAAGAGPAESQPADPALKAPLVSLVPSPRQIVLLGPVFLFGGALAASFTGWLAIRRGVRTAFTRKVFHFLIFSSAAAVHAAGGRSLVALFGGVVALVVLYGVLRGEGFAFYEALARDSDRPRRTLFILVPLLTTAIGGLLATLLFSAFAPVGYLVGGWGDAVGEPVGSRWGRRRYSVPSLGGIRAQRSLEGSGAVLLASFAAAALCLAGMGYPPARAAATALAIALAAALVEAISHHGTDNLTVQLAASGLAYALLA